MLPNFPRLTRFIAFLNNIFIVFAMKTSKIGFTDSSFMAKNNEDKVSGLSEAVNPCALVKGSANSAMKEVNKVISWSKWRENPAGWPNNLLMAPNVMLIVHRGIKMAHC